MDVMQLASVMLQLNLVSQHDILMGVETVDVRNPWFTDCLHISSSAPHVCKLHKLVRQFANVRC